MTKFEERYVLTKQSVEDGQVTGSVELKFSAIQLSDMLDHLDRFLKASGYVYSGELTISHYGEDIEIL